MSEMSEMLSVFLRLDMETYADGESDEDPDTDLQETTKMLMAVTWSSREIS